MKKILFLVFIIAAIPCYSAEQIDLATPHVVDPRSTSQFRISNVHFDWDSKKITIVVIGNGISKTFIYSGTQAQNMLIALNKANLSTNSLHKRIFNQLTSDGLLDGTVSGTPD